MKIIALEEHFLNLDVARASAPESARLSPDFAAAYDPALHELGFVGTLIHGRTEEDFLDAPRFDPILAKAAELQVPIYLHPGLPPRATSESNYERGLLRL